MSRVNHHDDLDELEVLDDIEEQLLTGRFREAITRLRAYLKDHPHSIRVQRRLARRKSMAAMIFEPDSDFVYPIWRKRMTPSVSNTNCVPMTRIFIPLPSPSLNAVLQQHSKLYIHNRTAR